MRSAAGLRTVGWSYEQRGVVATVETGTPNHTAWQRFLPNGPLALLPARSGYSNIVWSTSPDQVSNPSPMQYHKPLRCYQYVVVELCIPIILD